MSFLSLSLYAKAQKNEPILINDELAELQIERLQFGGGQSQTYADLVKNNLFIYYFELVYNETVVYRQSIRKKVAENSMKSTMLSRNTYDILLDASEISDGDKLKLVQNSKNKIFTSNDIMYLMLGGLEITKEENNKIVPAEILDNFKVNIYKVAF